MKFPRKNVLEKNAAGTIVGTRVTRVQGLQAKNSAFVRTRLVQVNERGQRINESHPRAVLTDHEVQLLLELRSEGFSYGWLAVKFEISKTQVGRIVRGEKRGQVPATWKRSR